MSELISFFHQDAISIYSGAKSWQHAIDLSMENLLENNWVTENYIASIKQTTLDIGSYYLLAPHIAMPHARPECGALKTALSLTLLREGVSFDADSPPVNLLIGLAAVDADSHIAAIQALSEMLCEDDVVNELLHAENIEALTNIIRRY